MGLQTSREIERNNVKERMNVGPLSLEELVMTNIMFFASGNNIGWDLHLMWNMHVWLQAVLNVTHDDDDDVYI